MAGFSAKDLEPYGDPRIKELEKNMTDCYTLAMEVSNIDAQIDLLKESIQHGEQLYEYCKAKGYTKYLREMWIRCRGRNGCFDYLKRTKAELRDLLKEYEEIKALEAARKEISEAIIKLVKDNPGISQKDLPDLLPGTDKELLRDTIYYLVKNNHVHQEKRGRSYALFPSQER